MCGMRRTVSRCLARTAGSGRSERRLGARAAASCGVAATSDSGAAGAGGGVGMTGGAAASCGVGMTGGASGAAVLSAVAAGAAPERRCGCRSRLSRRWTIFLRRTALPAPIRASGFLTGDFMYILIAILIFGFLIFIHELGHFLTAKALDVQVNEFSICMGPAIVKKQRGETLYALR